MAKARGLCPLGLWSGLHCIAALRTHAGVYRALVHCEILLRKPIETIAKYYTKWYDFAYIIKREGLKNQ